MSGNMTTNWNTMNATDNKITGRCTRWSAPACFFVSWDSYVGRVWDTDVGRQQCLCYRDDLATPRLAE